MKNRESLCISNDYLIERIVSCRSESLCFDGELCLQKQMGCFQPPLHLLSLRVMHIAGWEADCIQKRRAMIRISLECDLCDNLGRYGSSPAQLILSAPGRILHPEACGHLHLGARVALLDSCYLKDSAFHIRANIQLIGVLSEQPMLCRGQARPNCAKLPMYLIPCCDFHGRDLRTFSKL